MNNKIQLILIFAYIFAPCLTFAQDFKSLSVKIIEMLNSVAVFIMAIALLAFVIGIIRFMATAGDDKSRADGKQLMVWGSMSLFVMVAVWGIVAIVKKTFFG